MSLADARGAHPDLVVEEADEAADRALLEAVADWCDRYTPLVALDPPNGLFLDISGCAHLFAEAGSDGEAELLADCVGRLVAQGFAARGAVASTAGAGWAVSHYGEGGCVPDGAEAEAIAHLPVAALRITGEQEELLDRLGLKRIGQLIGKPRAPLAARFGADLVRRLDQALGREDEVLSPRRPAPRLSAERRFAEPVVDQAALLETVRSLARTLQPALERHGIGARLVEAAFFRIDGRVSRASVGTAAPIRAADNVAMLFSERLAAFGEDWDAGFGFDMVRLAVLQRRAARRDADRSCRRGDGRAATSPAWSTGSAHGSGRRASRASCRSTRMFPSAPCVARPLAASCRCGAGLDAAGGRGGGAAGPAASGSSPGPSRWRCSPRCRTARRSASAGAASCWKWRARKGRSASRRMVAAEDFERATRDYYRVEDADGRRYWLFREGLYGRETSAPDWYVHGLFA